MGFGGSQNKDNMRWGLLKGLEQGIGGFLSEHVDFVYDIDLVTSLVGGIVDLLPEVADIVNAGITGGINLNNVQSRARGYRLAHRTGIARFTLTVIGKAVYRLSQDAPGAGLTRASWAAKKIGMGYPTTAECIK